MESTFTGKLIVAFVCFVCFLLGTFITTITNEYTLVKDDHYSKYKLVARRAVPTGNQTTPPPTYPPLVYNKTGREFIIYNDLDTVYNKDGDKAAKQLARKVRLLCWVPTCPQNLHKKAQAVKDTWGKRCNALLFVSSKEDKKFPAVGLNVPEGTGNKMWLKTRAALQYIYDNHLGDADWFMKVDDDTFMIPENLRYFVSPFNSSEAHYFGREFKKFGGYNSGSSYVFSKETLKRFIGVMKDRPDKCTSGEYHEDIAVGQCLAVVGVHPGESRDQQGRQRFHPDAPEVHIGPGKIRGKGIWLYEYDKWPTIRGEGCCSRSTITLHRVLPHRMYVMEHLLYHMRPFGMETT